MRCAHTTVPSPAVLSTADAGGKSGSGPTGTTCPAQEGSSCGPPTCDTAWRHRYSMVSSFRMTPGRRAGRWLSGWAGQAAMLPQAACPSPLPAPALPVLLLLHSPPFPCSPLRRWGSHPRRTQCRRGRQSCRGPGQRPYTPEGRERVGGRNKQTQVLHAWCQRGLRMQHVRMQQQRQQQQLQQQQQQQRRRRRRHSQQRQHSSQRWWQRGRGGSSGSSSAHPPPGLGTCP